MLQMLLLYTGVLLRKIVLLQPVLLQPVLVQSVLVRRAPLWVLRLVVNLGWAVRPPYINFL